MNNIFSEGELDENNTVGIIHLLNKNSTCSILEQTQKEAIEKAENEYEKFKIKQDM